MASIGVGSAVLVLCMLLQNGCLSAQITYPLHEWEGKEDVNIHVEPLKGDSLSNSFLISVSERVPSHYHAHHSEHVYVISGKGRMWLKSDTFDIQPGDYIFIPQGSVHGVEVAEGELLKVLSIQSPEFKGDDRIDAE